MSIPAIVLNSSPDICDGVPIPADPMLMLRELAFATAINSGTVLAGNNGCTTIMCGARVMLATGTISRMKSKLGFSYSVALTTSDAQS